MLVLDVRENGTDNVMRRSFDLYMWQEEEEFRNLVRESRKWREGDSEFRERLRKRQKVEARVEELRGYVRDARWWEMSRSCRDEILAVIEEMSKVLEKGVEGVGMKKFVCAAMCGAAD
ncbi:hypothetical protein HDV00_007927 [Rhizophlyctis rosea]|nr:hypothetical protein HDV00_007927 [Rhizophlyctis rosea]